MRFCLVALVSILFGATPAAGFAEQNTPPALTTGAAPSAGENIAPAEQGYVLGASDVVDVSVQGRTDYNSRQRIAADGTIQLQFLGAVHAADKTTRQLGGELATALDKGGYFTRPVVSVEVSSYASRYVVVLGNVGTPGLVPVDRPYHLSEIVARVGGIKEAGADYLILRQHNGGERRLSLRAIATGDDSDDPLVSPGDKIYSPPAEVFYISGQVKLPGAYGVLPNMTVRMAISRGGGLTDAGTEKRITLTRGGKKQPSVAIDGKIEPGDVIVVGERLF